MINSLPAPQWWCLEMTLACPTCPFQRNRGLNQQETRSKAGDRETAYTEVKSYSVFRTQACAKIVHMWLKFEKTLFPLLIPPVHSSPFPVHGLSLCHTLNVCTLILNNFNLACSQVPGRNWGLEERSVESWKMCNFSIQSVILKLFLLAHYYDT